MRHYLAFTAVLAAALMVSSCGGNKEKRSIDAPANPRMSQSMERSAKDTAEVLDITRKYLDTLKDGDTEGALSQLYEYGDGTVRPLSDGRKAELRQTLKDFPVLSYQIDRLLMYSDSDTEVRYTVEFFEKPEGSTQPNTIKCAVNPVRVSGQWYLTVSEQTRENNYKND